MDWWKPSICHRSNGIALQSFQIVPQGFTCGTCRKQNRWLSLTPFECFVVLMNETAAQPSSSCSAVLVSWARALLFTFFLSSFFSLYLFRDCRQKKEELSQRIAEERARREEEEARRQEAERKRKDAEEEREKEERLRRQAEEREQKEREEMERIQKQVCSPPGISVPVWLAIE